MNYLLGRPAVSMDVGQIEPEKNCSPSPPETLPEEILNLVIIVRKFRRKTPTFPPTSHFNFPPALAIVSRVVSQSANNEHEDITRVISCWLRYHLKRGESSSESCCAECKMQGSCRTSFAFEIYSINYKAQLVLVVNFED